MSTSGTAPAGWHPDPENPTGALRWWDGTRWTEHVHPVASHPPAAPPAQPPRGDGWGQMGGFPYRGVRAAGPNQASKTAIGFAAVYVLLALTVHIELLGIVPVLAAYRAVRAHESLAPVAVVAAVLSLVFGLGGIALHV